MSIVYEVTLRIDAELEAEYDAWLEQHVAAMLALPGFESAEILAPENDSAPPGASVRVVHYRLDSRGAYEAYLEGHAERMRQEGIKHFGNRVRATRRLLRPIGLEPGRCARHR